MHPLSRILIGLASLALSTGLALRAAAAETPIYKCVDKNLSVLYTDEPCKDGERMNIRPGDADPAAVARLERERDALARSSAQRIADDRRAALQWQYLAPAPPVDALPPGYAAWADAAEYLPFGYGLMPYYPVDRPPASSGHRQRRFEPQHVVPAHPRVPPRM